MKKSISLDLFFYVIFTYVIPKYADCRIFELFGISDKNSFQILQLMYPQETKNYQIPVFFSDNSAMKTY
ncbi:hypothetical protein BpHYR1_001677 [Brachionus plicatilis]|uniref:Uncharacterized protein n=1 Tax=Brachionus plicatilis TaxID=10195 RepID=A0A3M7SNM9_BRAPC|nr:hypothetical protein BpHYR1_001677 [Brachionus plicatilis]